MSDDTRFLKHRTRVAYARANLEVIDGAAADRGQRRELGEHILSVGSARENDLVLSDNSVSRFHCELQMTDAGLRVRDHGSTNGVLVGGMRVFDALFSDAVELRLGETLIRVAPSPAPPVERELSPRSGFGRLVGGSPKMRALFADLEHMAKVNDPLLILGETGTGKDLVARSVHEASERAGAFVILDCGALPGPNLVDAELFGVVKGTFTDVAARDGLLKEADGGTLFIDELGELPLETQPKLLRFLESAEFRPLGDRGGRLQKVDVRVIAATNRNLAMEVKNRRFREDLYHRINVLSVVVPPLRDRLEDLRPLVEHFLAARTPTRRLEDVPDELWKIFEAHRWPGNLRELRSVVARFTVIPERALQGLDVTTPNAPAGAAPPLEAEAALTDPQGCIRPLQEARALWSDYFEQLYLERVLRAAGGHVKRAAEQARVSRQGLAKLIKKHRGTDPSDPDE